MLLFPIVLMVFGCSQKLQKAEWRQIICGWSTTVVEYWVLFHIVLISYTICMQEIVNQIRGSCLWGYFCNFVLLFLLDSINDNANLQADISIIFPWLHLSMLLTLHCWAFAVSVLFLLLSICYKVYCLLGLISLLFLLLHL